MLILTRKIGQKVYITGGIEVTVETIKGGEVQLGFVAPDEIQILREEAKKKLRDCEPS